MQRLKPGELVALENGGKHYVLPPADRSTSPPRADSSRSSTSSGRGGRTRWRGSARDCKPFPTLSFTRTNIYDRGFRSGMKAHEAFELVDARWTPRVLVDPSVNTGQYPRRRKS